MMCCSDESLWLFALPCVVDDHARQIRENVARLLRKERARQKLSLSVVGQRAGLSYQIVPFVERGQTNSTIETFVRIARALELDPAKILSKAQNPRSSRI